METVWFSDCLPATLLDLLVVPSFPEIFGPSVVLVFVLLLLPRARPALI
jgi:hypothetical protein